MTRADMIEQHLTGHGIDYLDNSEMSTLVGELIALATPTAYASIKDVADLTGRTKGTILSWIQRGQHDCPPALGTSSAGMVWDLDDWKRWVQDHPGLVRRGHDGVAFGVAIGRTDLV